MGYTYDLFQERSWDPGICDELPSSLVPSPWYGRPRSAWSISSGKVSFRWVLPTDEFKKDESALRYVEDPGIFIE